LLLDQHEILEKAVKQLKKIAAQVKEKRNLLAGTVQLTASATRNRGFIVRDSHETRANLCVWFEYSLE